MKQGLNQGREEGKRQGLVEGMRTGEVNGRRQLKAALAEIRDGYSTVEMLVSRGFSEETALDAVEIAGQFF